MKRLAWLTVNCSYSHSSLALPILHIAAKHVQNLEWNELDALTQDAPATITSRLAEHNPDIVAAPLYIFNKNTVLDVLARFKTLFPNSTIIVGGPECLGNNPWQLFQQFPFIDVIVVGEGETTFPLVLDALANNAELPQHPGIARKTEPEHNITPQVYHDWTTAPTPLASPFFRTDKPFVQIETSRGCPFGCQYCTSARTVTRYKDIQQVREELTAAQQAGIHEIRLIDRTFNTPENRCVQLLQLFKNEFPDIRFHLEIHPQFLTDAIKYELKNARPRQLHVEAGIQSLHDNVLQAVGRPPHAQQALEGLTFLAQCKPRFDTHCDLLAGLPEQDFDGLLQDLKTLINVKPAEIQLEILKILPGTILAAKAEQLGIQFSPTTPYDVMQTPHMSFKDIRKAQQLSRLIDLFHNHPALHDTAFAANHEHNDFIESLYQFLLAKYAVLDGPSPSLDSRFKILYDFFGDRYPEASFQLACAWLRQANTPAKPNAPAENAQLLTELPQNAQPAGGDCQRALETHGTRLWLLPHHKHPVVFALNRAIFPNRSAAEWWCC